MVRTLENINEAAKNPQTFIKECTEEYLAEIRTVAEKAAEKPELKIVAIAGPSASGKTTTAHILMRELEKLGKTINVISLDDFYKERKNLPVLSDGSLDIESVNSLDTDYMKQCFTALVKEGGAYMPSYDFTTGKRNQKGKYIKNGENSVLIVEGLHALNPQLSGLIPEKYIYKVYICLDKSVEDNDGKQFLTARQIRLVRRVIRDDKFRASDIKSTLTRWNNVLEGEIKYLFPFKDTADSKIRTMHPFEVCVYKEAFCRLRSGVDRNTPWYEFFIDTVNAMEQFVPIDTSYVPADSLIKEFIG